MVVQEYGKNHLPPKKILAISIEVSSHRMLVTWHPMEMARKINDQNRDNFQQPVIYGWGTYHNQSYMKWSVILKTLESLDICQSIGFALSFSIGTIWVCLNLRVPPNHSRSNGLSQWFQQWAIPNPAERMWAVFTLLTEKASVFFSKI